eukprot:845609_1
MASQIATDYEGENDFCFETWISQNHLTEVKHLFVKHGVTTPEALTFASKECKSLMTDPDLFQKSHMIPIIMDCVQKLQSSKEIVKIFISDAEQLVINNIEANLKQLSEIELDINGLKDTYPKSKRRIQIEKHKQIAVATLKMTNTFRDLICTINSKKRAILKEIERIKNNIDDDDTKENNVLEKSTQILNSFRSYLLQQLTICDELTSNNEDRKQRKTKIIHIGQDVKDQGKQTQISNAINEIGTIVMNTGEDEKSNKNVDLPFMNDMVLALKDKGIVVNKLSDICNLAYRLYSCVPGGHTKIADSLKVHIFNLGNNLIKKSKQGKSGDESDHELIRSLISLHDRFLKIVKHQFHSEQVFHKALKDAFEEFMNEDFCTSALLAQFANDILKKGTKIAISDLENTMGHVVMLYGYIRDKDIFGRDYQQYLASRLLQDLSEGEQSERWMIRKLKMESGIHWTRKLEGMFKDMQRSKELMVEFRQTFTELEVDLNVSVCRTGVWPASSIHPVKKPVDIMTITDRFTQFYLNRFSNRLNFQMDKGNADVLVQFNAKVRKTLVVSTYQMLVLLLFNIKDTWTFKEMMDATSIPKNDLQFAALSMAHPKVKVLRKAPNTKVIADDHTFQIN